MPLEVVDAKDAMILGLVSRYPKVGKKYIGYLSSKVKEAGELIAKESGTAAQYKKNQSLVDGLLEFGGRNKTAQPSKSTKRVRIR